MFPFFFLSFSFDFMIWRTPLFFQKKQRMEKGEKKTVVDLWPKKSPPFFFNQADFFF